MKFSTSCWVVLLLAGMTFSGNLSAATFTVNSILDTGDTNPGDSVCEATSGGTQCTLRAAIEEANARAGDDTIVFSLGLIVINISGSALPTIVDRLTIDGSTAPNYAAGEESAADAPPSVYINGSALTGTTADGFRFANGDALPRVFAMGIIGFPDNGIEVAGTDSVVIDRNWIGISRTGGIAGNGGSGVYLSNCERCLVGKIFTDAQVLEGYGNVINNNGEDGVFVTVGDDNAIAGNYIGFDPFGDSDQGNGGHGIHLQGPNNKIGAVLSAVQVPNYVTNNAGAGVRTSVGGNFIYANYIYNNGANGVVLNGSGNRLGFTNPAQGNRIYENTGHAVLIGSDFASPSNTVRRNVIFNNSQRGVQVSQGTLNLITENEIFDNGDDAIRTDADTTTISSNAIGVYTGILTGNGFNGIVVNSSGNTIGTNHIYGVDDDGIDVVSGNASQITGNGIGVGSSGQDYGNAANGIRVRAAATNTTISNNRIGNNNQNGVRIEGIGTLLCGNKIGLGTNFELAGNTADGIIILGDDNRVGSTSIGCAANDIGNNGSNGLQIDSAGNIVRDNYVGQRELHSFGNASDGILIANEASENEIRGNTLGKNAGDAIRVASTAGTRNHVQENIFNLNGTGANNLAIDIAADGVTANDANDADAGPNNVQNTPELLVMLMSPNQLQITYRMTSSTTNSSYPITVDFYRGFDASLGPGLSKLVEGVFVFRDVYSLAPNTSRVVQFDPQSSSGFGKIMAMATDAEGNSSEFSFAVSFDVSDDQPELIFKDGFETP